MSNEIIMIDSPEAAQPHTMQGWKSRDGLFFLDERAARYAGCTHVPCRECGKPTEKGWLKCSECREQADALRYEAMPAAEWDGEAMLYSQVLDAYFSTPDEAEEELDDGQSLADLRLVICEPNYCRQLDEDLFADELPEDGELPDHVVEAISAFNEAIAGTVLSWSPGKRRLRGEGE